MLIANASLADLPELVSLRHKTFSYFAPDFYSEKEVDTLLQDVDLNHWDMMIKEAKIFIMKDGDIIAGCCGWDVESIRHLYVDPSYARQGIASRLLKYTENDYKVKTGKTEIHAGIAIYARAFYESNGYLLQSEERDWDGSRYFKMKKLLD